MARKPDFETMFNPKSVAIIGASAKGDSPTGGAEFISRFRELGYAGRMYPINPKADQILGLKAYPSVGSLPETVDLAILSIPARFVPQILHECADAGVQNVHIFTAGFKETGEPEGVELENTIRQIGEERDLTIIGPNCMGLYVPKSGIVTWEKASRESGPVGFLSQSGGIASEYSSYARGLGIKFSKVISFGNATQLDCTDFLEYFADDPETEIIGMYLEGINDGRKLATQVREIIRRKPVVILKGGLTESGARAVASHTGSLAGSEAVWNAFFKQTGAVRVNTLEELMDITMTLLFVPPPRGRRVALLSAGGGVSVAGADACARAGLEVPTLTEETRRQLRVYVPRVAGTSIKNPLDVFQILWDTVLVRRLLDLIGGDPRIDALLFNLMIDFGPARLEGRQQTDAFASALQSFGKDSRLGKPVGVVLRSPGFDPAVEEEKMHLHSSLIASGVPVYPTLERAARALSKVAQYYEFCRERE